jgi:hypothetical protein
MKALFRTVLSVGVIWLLGACERHDYEDTKKLLHHGEGHGDQAGGHDGAGDGGSGSHTDGGTDHK